MGEATDNKPRFDALQAVRVVHALTAAADKQPAADTRMTDAVLTDWRAFLAANFNLTDDQHRWLDSADEARTREVQRLLRQTIENPGTYRLVVVLLVDHTKPRGLVHELRHEAVAEERHGLHDVRANLVIAHCDADCRNWGWGPA
jgi:hypothetical protein